MCFVWKVLECSVCVCVCVWVGGWVGARARVCVCVWVRACVSAHACVCVRAHTHTRAHARTRITMYASKKYTTSHQGKLLGANPSDKQDNSVTGQRLNSFRLPTELIPGK